MGKLDWSKLTDEKLNKRIKSLESLKDKNRDNKGLLATLDVSLKGAKAELEKRGKKVEKAVEKTEKEVVKDVKEDVSAADVVAKQTTAKPKTGAKKSVKSRAKQTKVSTSDFEITVEGKKYKFSDAKSKEQCQKAIQALKARREQAKKASGKYATKSITSKITSGMETIAKQAVSEAKDVKVTEKELSKRVNAVEKAFNDLFNKLESLMGKKISQSDREAVMSILQGFEKKQSKQAKTTKIIKKQDGGGVDWSDIDVDNLIMAKGGKVRTNSKAVRDKVKKHIMDSVYDYNEEEFKDFDGASEHVVSEFKRVADYPNNLRKFPNHQERFQDYLQGIPFNFEFENYKIEEFLNGLGINPDGKEYSSDQMWRLYSYLIWREVNDKYYKYAKGGKQGYDDRQDESLGMRTGKESTKKQSMKARRDDSYGKWGKRDEEKRDITMGKGGKAQGYDDKLDESLGNTRKRSTTKQSYKDRRDESKGMEKASGKRAYSRVKTMDKKMDGGEVNGWDWNSFL
tara:strand:- start:1574 stop:3112 length:1539 start_codon:yes stop_codon:yes gene_type:complete